MAATVYQIYAIDPLAVSPYRDRHTLAGAESDGPRCWPNLVRTDRHNHRSIAGDSAEAKALKVLARGHQSAALHIGQSPHRGHKSSPTKIVTALLGSSSTRAREIPGGDLMGRSYVLSSGSRKGLQMAEELPGDVALQASLDLADALAFGQAPGDVGLRLGVLSHVDHDDGKQRPGELAVTGPVEPMAGDHAR